MIKPRNLAVYLFFISVLSLSTIFGVPIDEAHPKKNFDSNSEVSLSLDKTANLTEYNFSDENSVQLKAFCQFTKTLWQQVKCNYHQAILTQLKHQNRVSINIATLLNISYVEHAKSFLIYNSQNLLS